MFRSGIEFAGGVVGLDGELTVPVAVNENGELDAVGPREVVEGVEGGAGGAAAEQDVVREDYGGAVEVAREIGGADIRGGTLVEVVAMEGGVELAGGNGMMGEAFEFPGEPGGEMDAAFLDPEEDEAGIAGVAFGNFVGHATDGQAEGVGVHQHGGGGGHDWGGRSGGRLHWGTGRAGGERQACWSGALPRWGDTLVRLPGGGQGIRQPAGRGVAGGGDARLAGV